MTTSAARDRVALLHALLDRLRSLTASITPEQLRSPGYPSEWSVAEVLSHIGSGSQVAVLRMRSTDPDGPSQEEIAQVWATWDALEPEQQAVEAVTALEGYVTALEDLSDEELAELRSGIGLDLDPSRVIALRVAELALHLWDVEVAVDDKATVAAEALPVLLDVLPVIVRWAARPPEDRDPQRVRFRLEGGVDHDRRDLVLELGGGSGHVVTDAGDRDPVDATVSLPTEAFVRLVYGRLDPQHTPEVHVDGATDLDRLRTSFPGL
jgi:uncharacterized protein (TIGR03083 family)